MDYLSATYFFDYESDEIQQLISNYKDSSLSKKEQAVALYLKIRDSWRYNPYNLSLSKENYKASTIAKKPTGHCVEKSILLIACLRALNIPARLHLGKVKNHIAVERLIEKFGTNELTPHGMVQIYLNGQWLKASPAFNAALCKMCKVAPLAFDGENNSFLQKFNDEGNLFMEYIDDYGYFEDVPVDFMIANVKEHYPHIFITKDNTTEFKL
ncbi:transglutaminase-like domain-containing protein [Tenacibaculum sp. M341]|uniref:transglutaminase-like domain-containing protein n=1 Tax=Tenacibaculum sp. M341 TaxID=2530339 RepID=UPI0010465BCB|nr:transglutaminase family protein [Tenacibaculum sp. M341]TCI85200.1 transglutaminase family protein [Tenacibaculum sp. M341]